MKNFYTSTLLISVLSLPVIAEEKKGEEKPKVEVSGHINSQFQVKSQREGKSQFRATVELKTKRIYKTRAVLSIQGRSEEAEAVYREAYIDHKIDKESKVQYGLAKKRLGLEYEESSEFRPTIRRSLLYKKLEQFALTGRDVIFRYKHESDDAKVTLAVGNNASLDSYAIGHYAKDFRQLGVQYGTWFLIQADRIDNDYQQVWTNIQSIWHDGPKAYWDLELMAGKNPHKSEFEEQFGDKSDVHFYGVKVTFAPKIRFNDSLWQLVLQNSVYGSDIREPQYNSMQHLIGLNYFPSDNLRFGVNVESTGSNNPHQLDKRDYRDNTLIMEARYDF